MNTAKTYRCRQTGAVITGADIPDRWSMTRWKPPMVKQHGKMVQPKLYFIFPAKDETTWDDYLFDMADVDPILPKTKPDIDEFSQRIVEGEPEELAGEWFENWAIEERFGTDAEKLDAAINRINNMAVVKRDRGITVDGIQIKTSPEGVALITGAKLAAQATSDFVVGSETYELTLAQVNAIFDAVNSHVQGTYSDRATLIKAAKAASNPLTVDVSALE